MRRTYTAEQKATAIRRVMAGEEVSAVADDMDITRTAVQNWLGRDVTTAVTLPHAGVRTHAERFNDDISNLIHAEVGALIAQMEHYGSQEWLSKQPPEKVLESTRTIGRALTTVLDRLRDNVAEEADAAAGNDAEPD